MKKLLKVLFWIIALLLFPITAGLYFIWPGRIFKDKLSQNSRIFWWITYGIVVVLGIVSKILICTAMLKTMTYTCEDYFL